MKQPHLDRGRFALGVALVVATREKDGIIEAKFLPGGGNNTHPSLPGGGSRPPPVRYFGVAGARCYLDPSAVRLLPRPPRGVQTHEAAAAAAEAAAAAALATSRLALAVDAGDSCFHDEVRDGVGRV